MTRTYNGEHYSSVNRKARQALRAFVVAAITLAALAISLSNLLELTNSVGLGEFDFDTSANVVIYAGPQARAAGIAPGDRIVYASMPREQRYGDSEDGLRQPPAGRTVAFVVERRGVRHVVRLTAGADRWSGSWDTTRYVIRLTTQKALFLVVVLLLSGLLLMRPTRATGALFLFVAGNGVVPVMYSFLPTWGYAVVAAADDALAAIGAIGFLALGYYMSPKRPFKERWFVAVSALLLAVIALPIAGSDVMELLAGVRPAWPIAGWGSFAAVWLCFVAGGTLLVRTAIQRSAGRSLRLLCALLAIVGALTVFNWTASALLNSWYLHNLPGVALNRGVVADSLSVFPWWVFDGVLFNVRLLGALAAIYILIRSGIGDAGPVYRRIVASVIVASFALAVLSLANIALMPRVAGYGVLVPLEILAAAAFGYWVSGLRDVACCLSLSSVEAWNAWANGRDAEERDALAQALGLAERTRRLDIIAEVHAQIAFSSWRNGEDGAFERKIGTVQRVLRGRNLRGIRAFAFAPVSEQRDVSLDDRDLPEWKARAALVLCARTDDSERAQQLAIDAWENAESAGLPSLQVLASIAVAEACADRRDASLERAHAIARDAGWPALSKSILALRANARDIGILQPFVEIRLRKSRPARPVFCISFSDAQLYVNGVTVALSEKQLELLLTVASARTGISQNALLDALWSESEGDAARNSLRVCLHGLRKNAGDARIVTRVGKGFVLHPWAEVDIRRFDALLVERRDGRDFEHSRELDGICSLIRGGEGRRATLGDWFFRFEEMLTRRLERAERLLARDRMTGVRR